MINKMIANEVIESLRKGIPPRRGINLYSVGHEKLIEGIKRFHIEQIGDVGKIRFVSGSWGSGKTHFFRLLCDLAFKNNCLVSNVELSVNDAPFNKFEKVFYGIIRNVSTPADFENKVTNAAPFSGIIQETLTKLGGVGAIEEISHELYTKACEKLMANKSIDIDFKKIILEYWKTYLPDSAEITTLEVQREELMQWFSGEGALGAYRKKYTVSKMVTRENAKLMLQSLGEFVKITGYNGLIILFDEAEQSYSVMRKSALRDAHNNLLSLINSIESLPGMFLIYATTPDFYTDPKHGIVSYGALSGRIGKPEDHPPKALETVWNLDSVVHKLEDYQNVAKKIRIIYKEAYVIEENGIACEDDLVKFVTELNKMHPSLSAVNFWRVMVASTVKYLDNEIEGEASPIEIVYHDVMDQLRED